MASHELYKRQTLGQRAEKLASDYLEQRGYEIIARNWRRPEGELDLIVSSEGLCIFVEVRSRTGTERGHPLETVDAHKRARVLRAARLYIDEEQPNANGFRFDVIGVTFTVDERPPELVHVENAFGSNWA
jgi:putative endonuclease